MLNKIIITDLPTAISLSFKETEYNAWISTVDDADRNKIRIIKNNLSKKRAPHLVQYFYDWSDEDNDVYIQKNLEQMGPQKYQIQNIITFLKELINSQKVINLGINCFAGVSRSTAIGVIAWIISGKTPEEALENILQVRSYALPNLRILKFASEILNIDIYNPILKWTNSKIINIQ